MCSITAAAGGITKKVQKGFGLRTENTTKLTQNALNFVTSPNPPNAAMRQCQRHHQSTHAHGVCTRVFSVTGRPSPLFIGVNSGIDARILGSMSLLYIPLF
jgi:hypothetical protein